MSFDPTKLTDTQLQNVIDHCRSNGIKDERCRMALAEHARRGGKGLSLDTTLKVVTAAARENRFISYAEIAAASGANWNQVRHKIGGHLWELIESGHNKGFPLLSAVIVNKPNVRTGEMEPSTLEGFVKAARELGYRVTDERAFLRQQQQKVFEWARSQPAGGTKRRQ